MNYDALTGERRNPAKRGCRCPLGVPGAELVEGEGSGFPDRERTRCTSIYWLPHPDARLSTASLASPVPGNFRPHARLSKIVPRISKVHPRLSLSNSSAKTGFCSARSRACSKRRASRLRGCGGSYSKRSPTMRWTPAPGSRPDRSTARGFYVADTGSGIDGVPEDIARARAPVPVPSRRRRQRGAYAVRARAPEPQPQLYLMAPRPRRRRSHH